MQYFLTKRMLCRRLFAYFDAESRGVSRKPITVLSSKRITNDVPSPGDVGEHVFLDQKVRRAESEVQRGRVGHRAQRIMGRNAHIICLRHGGDLFRLGQSSAMTKIRLNDVTGLFLKHLPELKAGNQTLAGR